MRLAVLGLNTFVRTVKVLMEPDADELRRKLLTAAIQIDASPPVRALLG